MSITDDVRAAEPRPQDGRGGEPRGSEPRAGGDGQFDRTPPQDVAAEQCVLGGMLLSKDAIADVVEILRANDFYRPAHTTIFDAILDIYGRGEPADPITVAAALHDAGTLARVGGAAYLHTLIASVPTAANAAYYAKIVSERAVLRRLIEAGTRIVQLGYGAGRETDDLVDMAQQAVYEITERRVSEDFAALGEMLQPTLDEIEAVGAQGGMMSGVPTGFTDLDRLLNGLHAGQLIIVAGRPGLGKALALDTPLPTPAGWTTMGAVQVGDQLIDAEGRPTTVTAATEVMRDRPCYEVEFSDGSVIVADGSHRWLTRTRKIRRHDRRPQVCTTDEIRATLRMETADRRANHSITNTLPLALPERDLPIPAYTLGLWLGDGHRAAARFTTDDPEIILYVEDDGFVVRPSGPRAYTMMLPGLEPISERDCVVCGKRFQPRATSVTTCGRSCGGKSRFLSEPGAPQGCANCGTVTKATANGATRCAACRTRFGSFTGLLRDVGVLDNKHIPPAYLRASEAQRRALLAGLMDTDGTVAPTGDVQYCSTSRRLAEDVYELVISLGYRCTMTTKKVRGRTAASSTAYVLNFTTVDDVFRLERKRLIHKERRRSITTTRTGSRFIVDVRPTTSVPVRCVQVDNDEHLYLAGRSMIPTHNSTASLDFARHAAIRANQASAIFSLEMSKVEIVMRVLSAEARVPLHVLRSGQLSDDDWTKLARSMGEISDAPLFVDDTPNMNLMEIRAKARRLKQKHDLKLIVVDYLQLMSSPKRTESRQQEVAELSRGLKLLAKEVECPVIAVSQLNRGPEQRTDKRPQLSDLRESGCMTADTTLLRADTGAPITFEALLRNGFDGISVWSMDEYNRMVARPIVNVFPSGTKTVYRLTLASGRTVKASANHRFRKLSGWTELGAIQPGDRVAVPRRTPAPINAGLGWSEHRIGILAHLIGDGCVLDRQPLHYTSEDEENLTFVEEAAAAEFGITARRVKQGNWQHTYLPSPHRLTHGRRNPIHQWFGDMGIDGLRSYEKHIPDELYSADDGEVRLFLRHLWAADGCVFVPKPAATKSVARIYYATSSRALADGVAHLLSRIGIATRIYQVSYKNSDRPGYHVSIAGVDDMRRFCEEVGVHGARSQHVAAYLAFSATKKANTNVDTLPREVWELVKTERYRAGLTERQFQAAIGTNYCGSTLYKACPSRERLTRCAEALDSDVIRDLATDDVFWDQVVSVEEIGELPVFDATVKGTHNFIADGIVAHNSIEQDADVVILLHRDDYYDKESPRAGEADFIIAKHRNGPTDTVTVAAQLHLSRFVDMAV